MPFDTNNLVMKNAQLLSCVQLFATPRSIAHQAPLSMGFPRQEYWSEVLLPPPGESSRPRDWTCISCIADRFFTCWAIRSMLQRWGWGLSICFLLKTWCAYVDIPRPLSSTSSCKYKRVSWGWRPSISGFIAARCRWFITSSLHILLSRQSESLGAHWLCFPSVHKSSASWSPTRVKKASSP